MSRLARTSALDVRLWSKGMRSGHFNAWLYSGEWRATSVCGSMLFLLVNCGVTTFTAKLADRRCAVVLWVSGFFCSAPRVISGTAAWLPLRFLCIKLVWLRTSRPSKKQWLRASCSILLDSWRHEIFTLTHKQPSCSCTFYYQFYQSPFHLSGFPQWSSDQTLNLSSSWSLLAAPAVSLPWYAIVIAVW